MKTALITGCSSGIGRGVVTALLGRGWSVIATMRDAVRRAELLSAERRAHGDRFALCSLDVTDGEERAEVAAQVAERGGLDLLVNNAGYGLFGALEDLSEEQLRRQLEVNFTGAVLLTQAVLPQLRARRGAILNVSSVLGEMGFPLTSAYCASKYALAGWSEALHYELAPYGVRVGVVAPGGHRTEFGANVEWATGSAPTYRAATEAYRALLDRVRARRGSRPDPVVAAIVALAEADRVPIRTLVGKDAQAFRLGELLPERARTRMYELAFRRLFHRSAA
jgi:NAD(P)-dependent dehydrogenase (short-subunit alcohol dehydrogenase family)